MKKFLMISCLLFACMAIQAAELRSFQQPPENDVGYVAMTTLYDTAVMNLNMETIDLQWLGTGKRRTGLHHARARQHQCRCYG